MDSDWAGCHKTTKSAMCCAMYLLGKCVGVMPKTQGLLALSSGEAELYAIGFGVMATIFQRNFLREVNLAPKVTITIHTDSVAGKSMATRYGASRRTRHIELRYFYMQSLVTAGLLRLIKIGESKLWPSWELSSWIVWLCCDY